MALTYAGRYGPFPVMDSRGNALVGAQVYVYEDGSGTLATLYSDKIKSSTVSNPVTADAYGNAEFFTVPGTYDITVKVNGVTRLTDNVTVPVDPADVDEQSASGHINDADDAHGATAISYDNTTSGLAATEVQAALDEIASDSASSSHTHTEADISDLGVYADATGLSANFFPVSDGADGWTYQDFDAFTLVDADQVSYDNASSGLTAEDVQAAIDELDTTLDAISQDADGIAYDNSTSGLAATDVQAALDEIDSTLDTVTSATVPVEFGVACSDEETAIDSTGTKATFRLPCAMTLTAVRASLTSAASSGTFTVDINEGGTSVLSTKLTIDATEKTSTTAATAAVISDSNLADDAEITIDVDNTGDDTATGLKVWLIGTRT